MFNQTQLPSPQRQAHTRSTTSSQTTTQPARKHCLGLVYGRLVYRFRWGIIALWAAAVITSIPFAHTVATVLHNGGYSISGSESNRVNQLLVHTLHRPATQVLVLFQSADTPVNAPAYRHEINDFIVRAKQFPHVISVMQGQTGQDERTTFVTVGFDQEQDVIAQRIPDFRTLLSRDYTAGPARAYVTGDAAVASEIESDTQADTEYAEAVALPISLLVLLIVFGTLVAGLMPLLLAAVAVPVSLAVIYAIALHIETNIFVLNVASIIGLGLSIDYSLFITRRFREELAHGYQVCDALAHTVATAGEAILFSGVTVIIGFAGLLFIGIQIMTSFGIGGIAVTTAAVLAALTLLPALLAVLGSRINALRLPPLTHFTSSLRGRGTMRTGERPGFWHSWAMLVMGRPVLIVLLVTVVLVGLGFPARSLNPGLPGVSALPTSSEARYGLDLLRTQFPAANTDPISILVQTPHGSSTLTRPNLARLAALTRWIAAQPHVTQVISLTSLPEEAGTVRLSQQQLTQLYSTGAYQRDPGLAQFVASTTVGNTTLITVRSDTPSNTSAGQALIDRLRTVNTPAKQGLTVLVGGHGAMALDFDRSLYGNSLRTLLFILLATYALLLLMFRSLLLPLKALLMNVLSIGAAYGALVFVFQQGHFEPLLGFTSDGSIDRFIPILLFCVLFGLSMDYEVFLLSRIREEWLRTHDNRTAVARGLEQTGGVITNAALLFVIVSGAFTFTSLIVTKELGLGITVAVLVDATIIRSLLVPATMQLMGGWNWWLPGRVLFRRGKPPARVGRAMAGYESLLPAADEQGCRPHDRSEQDRGKKCPATLETPYPLLDTSWLPTLPLSQAGLYQRALSRQPAQCLWLALVDHPDLPLERSLAFHIAQALAERSHKRVLLLEVCGRDQAVGPHFARYGDQIRPSVLACTHTRSLLARHRAPTTTADGTHFAALTLLTGQADRGEQEWPDLASSGVIAATISELAEWYDYVLFVTTPQTPAPLMQVAAAMCERSAVLLSAPRGEREQKHWDLISALPLACRKRLTPPALFVAHVPSRPTIGMQDAFAAHVGRETAGTVLADSRLTRLLPADDALLDHCWQQQIALCQVMPQAALTQAVDFVARHLARQTVGIAFGGGGARGFAHIGVLKRLLGYGVPLDYLAGCSIGVISPAMYLMGKSFAEIEETFLQVQAHIAQWRFPRTSIFSNKGLKHMLDEFSRSLSFEDLSVPLAMVAVDLASRAEAVLDRGPLWRAVLASVAVPGIFPPVVIGNQVLVDAGMHDPVPVRVVRSMGADVVLAARLSTQGPPTRERPSPPCSTRTEWRQQAEGQAPHILDVLWRSYDIAMATISQHSVAEADVVIHPKLHRVSLRQFSRGQKFIAAGEQAVEEALPALRKQLPWIASGK